MDMNDLFAIDLEMYYDGKMNFMVGLCEQMGLAALKWKKKDKLTIMWVQYRPFENPYIFNKYIKSADF